MERVGVLTVKNDTATDNDYQFFNGPIVRIKAGQTGYVPMGSGFRAQSDRSKR